MRQSLWKQIDYNTILFDRRNDRRVVVIWTGEHIERGWPQPCYGKDDRWDRAPNYLQVKVLSCDGGEPFIQDWKITVKEVDDGELGYARILKEEDVGRMWVSYSTRTVQDGHDHFCSTIDIITDNHCPHCRERLPPTS